MSIDNPLYLSKVDCMDWNNNEKKRLVKAILNLENQNEVESFLRDLLTLKEIDEFAKRLETASLLSKGVQYSAIEEQTGFSSRTIARVSHWLKNGKGGYKLALEKLHQPHRTTHAKRGMV